MNDVALTGAGRAPSRIDRIAAALAPYRPRPRGRGFGSPAIAKARANLGIAIIRTMRDTLARVSEAAAFTWQQIERRPDGSGTITFRRPKTDADTTAYLAPATVAADSDRRPTGHQATARTGNGFRSGTARTPQSPRYAGQRPRPPLPIPPAKPPARRPADRNRPDANRGARPAQARQDGVRHPVSTSLRNLADTGSAKPGTLRAR